MTRRYLNALMALNLVIIGLIAGFFWYHQRAQDQTVDKIVRYHTAAVRAVHASLAELHYISDELWRQALLADNTGAAGSPGHDADDGNQTLMDHISALARERDILAALRQDFADPQFKEVTESALRAFDPVLSIGPAGTTASQDQSARLGLLDALRVRLDELEDRHMETYERLIHSDSYDGLNHPQSLFIAIGLLVGFSVISGVGAVRNVTAAAAERETALRSLRKNESRLAHLADGLEAAQRIARISNWERDPDSDLLEWPPQMRQVLGLPPSGESTTNDDFMAMLHPDDRESLLEEMRCAIEHGEPYALEYRFLAPDGETRTIVEYGEPFTPTGTDTVRLRGTIQDITERKDIERRLATAVRGLNKAQQIAHIGSWEWDAKSDKYSWSDECFRILGVEPGSLEPDGRTVLRFVHPDDLERVTEASRQLFTAGMPLDIEYRILRADGVERVLLVQAEKERDEAGAPTRMVGIGQDVTELRRRERELRETQERFSLAFQLSPSATAISEVETGIHVDVNDKWVEILGRSREEAIGQTAAEMGIWASPEDRARAISLLRKDGRFRDFEAQYRTRGGELRDFMISAEPFLIGDRPHMLIVGYDITERKKAELALRETKQRLEEAQRLGQMGSWTWNPEEDVEWWSDEHYRIFGLEPGSVVLDGFGFLRYVHPDDLERVEKVERQAAENHTPFSIEYRIVRPDGTERTVAEHGEWIEDDTAGIPQWRGVVQDITERKCIEQELAQLNAELEQRVEERTAELRAAQDELVKRERLATLGQLTATVSHELRNPLGAIRTSLYVVERKIAQHDDRRMAEALGRINRSITRCDNIIDELLDFTRMREVQFQRLNIDSWLISLLDEQAAPQGVSVRTDFGIGDVQVPADPDRLRRAVINIYENACQAVEMNGSGADGSKDTLSGYNLSVSTRLGDDRIEIIIEDTGPGIAKDSLDRMFEPLYSTKNFGVGLGLPIVRQIMEQHGGGVEARNRIGGGARFVLWLPLETERKNAE